MDLFIQSVENGETVVIQNVEPNTTGLALKIKIKQKYPKFPIPSKQRLIFCGREFTNSMKFSELDISQGTTLQVAEIPSSSPSPSPSPSSSSASSSSSTSSDELTTAELVSIGVGFAGHLGVLFTPAAPAALVVWSGMLAYGNFGYQVFSK